MGPVIASAVAERAYPGLPVSGDKHVIKQIPQGVLVAVVDGLGHGPDAAWAAQTATTTLERYAGEEPSALVQRCHEALRRTRGVAMSLAFCHLNARLMTWLGVGNVEGLLLRCPANAADSASTATNPPREALLLRGGVVGYQLPPLRPSTLSIGPGDVLALATDGIRSEFAQSLASALRYSASLQSAADATLARYGRQNDDALILIVRFGEPRP